MLKTHLKKLLCLAGIVLFAACQSVDEEFADEKIQESVLAQIGQLGFSTSNVFKAEFNGKKGYVVEFDIFLTDEDISSLLNTPGGASVEHYHTFNLVKGLPRVIKVGIDPVFSASTVTAFRNALAMYNAENLTLTFVETPVTVSGGKRRTLVSDANILISSFSERPRNGFITLGRAAGFPTSSGDPANGFALNTYWIDNFRPSIEELTGVMAHEIGHTIGFRHTDYATRESCGSINPEGAGTVGAVYIPGSPTGSDASSLMQACGPARVLNANDKAALNYLY